MRRKSPPRRGGHFLFSRGRARCFYCLCSFDWDDRSSEYYPTREHKQPRSKGGKDGNGNVVLACRRCNNEKGNMTLSEYREYLEVTKGCTGRVARKLRWRKHIGLFHRFDSRTLAEDAGE